MAYRDFKVTILKQNETAALGFDSKSFDCSGLEECMKKVLDNISGNDSWVINQWGTSCYIPVVSNVYGWVRYGSIAHNVLNGAN